MGRYRALVAALVQHTNIVGKNMTKRSDLGEGVALTPQEWQIFEHILEYHNETFSMITLSKRLGIPQSSFSRMVKRLCSCGLVDKYQAVNNRKNIILKPTDFGQKIYREHSGRLLELMFRPFFEALDPVSEEDLDTVTEAIKLLNATLDTDTSEPDEPLLVRMD